MTRLTHWLVPFIALVSTSACSSDSDDSNAKGPGPAFCGNDACDGSETPSTCPHDCPASCGDGACTGSEHCQSCAEDCGACAPGCGDGTCNASAGESCSSCAPDCGQCADVCGDGACGPSETCSSCAGDCGACPGTGGSGGGGAGGSGGTSSGGNGGTSSGGTSSGGTSSGGTSSGGSSGTGGSGTGTSCYGGSWTAPLGIPCPSFGIAEQAGPTTLVVNNSNGIPDVIPAGTVIEIQGNYSKNHTSPNDFTCAGTAAKPVFIRGAAGSLITGGWEVHGSYCILENLHFGPSSGAMGGMVILAPADHVALRNSDIAGDGKDYGGTGVLSWDNAKATDIVLYKNFIHDGGDINAGFDQDVHGIGVSENVNHLWVLENEITKNSGDGIQVNGSTNGLSETHHIYIGKNHFHHNKQAGIGVKQASDVILSENDSHDHRPSDSSGGDCITAQYGPERLWVIYNRLHSCDSGVKLASDSVNNPGKDQYFVGNVIYDVHSTAGFNPNTGYSEACIALWGGTNRYVVNNTCSDADSGVRSPSSDGTFLVANNIFSGIIPAGHHLFRESGPAMQSRRNLTDVALKQVGAGTCTNCVVGNPGFKGAAAGDFALNAGSAAIDAAAEEAVYATFQTLYGLDIRRDAGGNPRPQGANWDIGAYEAP